MIGALISSANSPPLAQAILTGSRKRIPITLVSGESLPSLRTNILYSWTTILVVCPQKILNYLVLPSATTRSTAHPGIVELFRGSSLGVARKTRKVVARAMAEAAGDAKVLITFDVDGTLMQSIGDNANQLHKKSFSFAFQEVFGIDGTIDVIKHHGSTDPMVLINTLEHYGVPTETATAKLPQLKSKMLEYAKNNSTQVGQGLELLPGVATLLETLSQRKDVVVALVTGNLEDIGWLKMDALGIRPFFSTPNFGGFGSDHIERGELVKIAAVRARTNFPEEFSRRVHVGDTPNDICAAEYGGALAIGVCTGAFSRDELLAASKGANVVILDDLKDTKIFLKACGLGQKF